MFWGRYHEINLDLHIFINSFYFFNPPLPKDDKA